MQNNNLFSSIVLFILLSIFLVGCGTQENEGNSTNGSNNVDIPEIIEVTIKVPQKIELNQEINIQSVVTQGDETVSDASEVVFEVWESGSDDHEMIDASNEGNGVYSINKTFIKEGIYYVVSHVTARDMHSMPKEEIVVGQPVLDENNHSTSDESKESGEEAHHQGHGVTINFSKDETIQAGKDTTLTSTIQEEEQPLTDANVQFEVWRENTGENKRDYIQAEELEEGKYQVEVNLKESGKYLITIHVKKGKFHDHIEAVVTVQ
jgi:hypothetical protein